MLETIIHTALCELEVQKKGEHERQTLHHHPLVKYLKVMYATEHTATTVKVFFSLDFHTFDSSSRLTFFFMFSTRFDIFCFRSSLRRLRISVVLLKRKQRKFIHFIYRAGIVSFLKMMHIQISHHLVEQDKKCGRISMCSREIFLASKMTANGI